MSFLFAVKGMYPSTGSGTHPYSLPAKQINSGNVNVSFEFVDSHLFLRLFI